MSKYRPQGDWEEADWDAEDLHQQKHMKLHDKRRDSSKQDFIRNRRRESEARKSFVDVDDTNTRVYKSPGRS